MQESRQLVLPFTHQPQFAAEDFVASPGNAEARAWLDRPEGWTNGRLLITGPAGSGKSHLLHVWARATGAEIRPAAMVRGLPAPPAGGFLAVDDADTVADPAALFHLLNLAAEAHVPVLLTARRPPVGWGLSLADLLSRLRASTHAAIAPPDDALLRALLARLAAERQMSIPPNLADYLLLHLPRTAASLREAPLLRVTVDPTPPPTAPAPVPATPSPKKKA